jgi:hypothetical protein
MTNAQLVELQKSLASLSQTADVVGVSKTKIWYWQRGAARLSSSQQEKLQDFLFTKLKERLAQSRRFFEFCGKGLLTNRARAGLPTDRRSARNLRQIRVTVGSAR